MILSNDHDLILLYKHQVKEMPKVLVNSCENLLILFMSPVIKTGKALAISVLYIETWLSSLKNYEAE